MPGQKSVTVVFGGTRPAANVQHSALCIVASRHQAPRPTRAVCPGVVRFVAAAGEATAPSRSPRSHLSVSEPRSSAAAAAAGNVTPGRPARRSRRVFVEATPDINLRVAMYRGMERARRSRHAAVAE